MPSTCDGPINSTLVLIQGPLGSPTVSNPTKNSLRTNGVGLSTFDCTLSPQNITREKVPAVLKIIQHENDNFDVPAGIKV